MALTTTGLPNGGVTAHYAFQYDDSLSPPINPTGPEPARTIAVIGACENDFNLLSGWFANIALDVGLPIPLIAEMTEQFMRSQGSGWFGFKTEGSEGEGLSRFLAAQFLAVNGLGNPPAGFLNSNSWMASSRADYVNVINPTDDGPDVLTGCSLLFIWYLFSQLGFSVNAIVAAGAPTLGGVYRNLTGDPADPFPTFKRILDNYFPGTATISGPNPDNPFPLANPFTLPINHIFWDAPTNQLYRDQWTQAAVGDPATMVWPNQQHIFYRGIDGVINHIFWDAPTNHLYWDDWTKVGAPPAAGDPATMVWPNQQDPNQQHIFYRGTEGAINHIFWDAPTNNLYWDQWTQVGAPPAAGDPATMVWPGQQHIFYRGTGGAINHIFWDAPTGQLYWDDWTQVGAPLAAGDPATMVWPNQQHVFYRGANGAINHIFWDAPTNHLYWDDWTQVGAPLAAGDPATMVWPDQQHVFYRGADGAINHIFWDAPTNRLYWDDWTQVGAPLAAGDPVTMVWPDQQHVFYRGVDGGIVHIFWDAPTNHLYWDEWTQATGAPGAAGGAATMVWPTQQHIFYRG